MYPDSPFSKTLNSILIGGLQREEVESRISKVKYEQLMKWLCRCPKISSYRINSLKCDTQEAFKLLNKYFIEAYVEDSIPIEIHPLFPNVIIIHHKHSTQILQRYGKEIIVDPDCASAILRGAHVYAPGVLGMTAGTRIGESVSIYADLNKKCKRGLQKVYNDEGKLFIGNGTTKMQRYQLFAENVIPRGVAVELTDSISGCPALNNDKILPVGSALLQNLPSILCVLALNPKPGDNVLDMCASPGNKTTHIAELMLNEGTLIALDKTPKKVAQLKLNCTLFGVKADSFIADSTKILLYPSHGCSEKLSNGPPFPPQSFDKILLDSPCSVLGKRPQLVNYMSENEIKSYVPLQRKLFEVVAFIIGISGACRREELCKMTINDVEDKETVYIIKVPETKNGMQRIFTILNPYNSPIDYLSLIKKYTSLRPSNINCNRLFLKYANGKCSKQPVGINTFGKMPCVIATYLNLPTPVAFTGHCFRRSSATMLANSGGDLLTIKKHGGWKSSAVAEGYVDSTITQKNKISSKILMDDMPSTSKQSPYRSYYSCTIDDSSEFVQPLETQTRVTNNVMSQKFSNSVLEKAKSINFGGCNNCTFNINISNN